MQVVKIEHNKCNEYDGTEYMLAPDDWSNELIRKKVSEAVRELIEDAKALKEGPAQRNWWKPPYEEFPDKTVAEVNKIHQDWKLEYKQWQEENNHLGRSFETRLVEKGFTSLWHDEAPVVKVRTDWGHNHGLTLNYRHSEF